MSDEISRMIVDYHARRRATTTERERLDNLIARHTRKRDDLRMPYVGDFLEEMFSALARAMPGITFEVMGPFGLDANYGVSVRRDDDMAHLSFRGSGEDSTPVLMGEDTGRFAPGTIGSLNRMGRRSIPLGADLADLRKLVEDQFAENRQSREKAS